MAKQKKSEAADKPEKVPMKRMTFDVAEELHRKLKVRAAEMGKSMAELLLEWINENLAKPKH